MNFNKFQVCWRINKTQSVQTQPKRGRNEQQEKQDDTESVIKTSEQIYCLHRASFCPASHLASEQVWTDHSSTSKARQQRERPFTQVSLFLSLQGS